MVRGERLRDRMRRLAGGERRELLLPPCELGVPDGRVARLLDGLLEFAAQREEGRETRLDGKRHLPQRIVSTGAGQGGFLLAIVVEIHVRDRVEGGQRNGAAGGVGRGILASAHVGRRPVETTPGRSGRISRSPDRVRRLQPVRARTHAAHAQTGEAGCA